jgi:hypothetical protein
VEGKRGAAARTIAAAVLALIGCGGVDPIG